MVCHTRSIEGVEILLILMIGVDACNTVLEVLLFAAATNLGQSWNTVLTLFGGKNHFRNSGEKIS